jgi:hypothetical protein
MHRATITLVLTGFVLTLPLTADALDPGPYSGGRGGTAETAAGIPDAGIAGFVGPAGEGIKADGNYVNPIFKSWATGIVAYQPSPTRMDPRFETPTKTLGPATGDVFDIASLGDMSAADLTAYAADPVNAAVKPGYITLSFGKAITNHAGPDFAVFENAFASDYDIPSTGGVKGGMFAELAYVEASTNGVDFARFPSIYLNTAANLNLSFGSNGNPTNYAYGTQDPAYIYNLAGKHGNGYGISWGTPFNLDDLANDPTAQTLIAAGKLNLNDINYIKLVDIPGNGSFTDSQGHPIYDAWQTYGSGGFDLDAIGVLNQVPEPSALCLLGAGAIAFIVWRRSNN